MGDVRVVVRQSEIADLVRSDEMRVGLLAAAQPLVRGSQVAAPHRTGAGATSIRAEAVLDGPEWTARVSWDRTHFYMYFQHEGTRSLPARPFMVHTLEGLTR